MFPDVVPVGRNGTVVLAVLASAARSARSTSVKHSRSTRAPRFPCVCQNEIGDAGAGCLRCAAPRVESYRTWRRRTDSRRCSMVDRIWSVETDACRWPAITIVNVGNKRTFLSSDASSTMGRADAASLPSRSLPRRGRIRDRLRCRQSRDWRVLARGIRSRARSIRSAATRCTCTAPGRDRRWCCSRAAAATIGCIGRRSSRNSQRPRGCARMIAPVSAGASDNRAPEPPGTLRPSSIHYCNKRAKMDRWYWSAPRPAGSMFASSLRRIQRGPSRWHSWTRVS